MLIVSLLLSLLLSGLLLGAALEKLRMRARFAQTLADLGFRGQPGRLLVIGVPAVEAMTAAGLLLVPGATWPRVAVGALGAAFGVAGVIALRVQRPVTCSCLGAGQGTLGLRQILLLPAWLAAALLLHLQDSGWSTLLGLQYLAAVTVILAVVRSATVAKAALRARGNRQAIDEAARVRRPIVVRYEGGAVL